LTLHQFSQLSFSNLLQTQEKAGKLRKIHLFFPRLGSASFCADGAGVGVRSIRTIGFTGDRVPLKSILFVCLGNICRSPAAQGIAQSLIDQRGWSKFLAVDSAGTSNYQLGKPADPHMQRAAHARGYLLQTRSKQLTERMIRDNDLVVAMDRDNFREIFLISRGEPANVRLLSEYLDGTWPRDVPDPYQGPEQGFEYVLDMLESALPSILDSLQSDVAPVGIGAEPT
jgi:protein-tyrosine phosphatase